MDKQPQYVDVDDCKTRECRHCGAEIGEPCVTARGTVMQTTHFDRDPE
jgi:hypothetical protein